MAGLLYIWSSRLNLFQKSRPGSIRSGAFRSFDVYSLSFSGQFRMGVLRGIL